MKFTSIGATLAAVVAAISLGTGAALAQQVSLGTHKSGAQNAMASAIASVVSEYSDLNMRTQAFGGAQKYIPMVNAGRIDFGITTITELRFGVEGRSLSEGYPSPNLRVVASLAPFRVGYLVAADSGIATMQDMKGKSMAGGFDPQPLARLFHEAYLANAGMTYEDVRMVPSSGWREHWNAYMAGDLDGVVMALGTGAAQEIEAKVGAMRYVDLSADAAAVEAMQEYLPGVTVEVVGPEENIVGLDRPAGVAQTKYTLWAGKQVSDDVAYTVAKTLYEHPEQLAAATPHFTLFDPQEMAEKAGVEFHPGAIRFYKDVGVWQE